MGDIFIKSALEIAKEKVEKMGEVTEQERLRWKYMPEGEKLAARCLNQECNMVVELKKFPENVRKYITDGAEDILVRNINLPKDDGAKRRNRQAMDALKAMKGDKVGVENVHSRMRRIFDHYREQGEKQKDGAYKALKAEFEEKVQAAVKQQLGSYAAYKIDVESQPQFQEEWRKVQSQLDSQYIMLLEEYKRELKALD